MTSNNTIERNERTFLKRCLIRRAQHNKITKMLSAKRDVTAYLFRGRYATVRSLIRKMKDRSIKYM